MTRAWGVVAALSLLTAATGAACTAPQPVRVDFSETPRDYQSKEYADVYQRWTRHGLCRFDVDAALETWVTYKGWDYREAYVEHYATIYSLAAADKALLRTAQLDSFHTAYEFHVTAQSSNYKWNDLEKRSSAWRVALVDGLGHELAPESVKLEKLPDPYEVEFFPAKGPFTRSYAIRFVRPAAAAAAVAADGKASDFVGASTGTLVLRLSSPVGRIDLDWQSYN
jgi:hypothetical protein